MWKQFSLRGTYKWIDILQSLVSDYNKTKHRTIKMKPDDVTHNDEQYLLNTVYRPLRITSSKAKFKIGDLVRISKYKHLFEKGYTPNWTGEVFKIRRVQKTDPITYLLQDLSSAPINGCFYTEELQLTKCPKIYLIDKILRKKGDKLYIKWLGLDKKHNSWIHKSKILD